MRHLMAIGLALLLPAIIATAQTFQSSDLQRVERVQEVAISPDGQWAVYSINTKRPLSEGKGSDSRKLYLRNLNGSTNEHLELDFDYFHSLQWRPGHKQVSFLARGTDNKGRRSNQVFIYDLKEGDAYPITEANASIRDYDWHGDGTMIAYVIQESPEGDKHLKDMGFDAEVFEEDVAHHDLWILNTETGTHRQVTKGVSVWAVDWAGSSNYLAAQITDVNSVDASYMDKRIYQIDAVTNERTLLINNPGKLTDMAWSPDGKHLAFVSAVDENDPVSGNLYIVPKHNKQGFAEITNYTEGFEGSVNNVYWKDRTTVLFTSDESTYRTVRKVRVGGQHEVVIPGGNLVMRSLSVTSGKMVFVANNASHPDELFAYSFSSSAEPRRLTHLNDWLKGIRMGKQETISWKAKDGLRVDGILIYPVDYVKGKAYPLITYVHGGPEACVQDGWLTWYSSWGQIAAGKGYFVLHPNYRSSSGRGVAYSKMGQADLADEEFTDILDGIDMLIEKGMVDKSKVGIGGGSYGGYFSMWGATKHSDRFAAAVSFVGVSNQISKRNTTDIPKEDYLVHWNMWTNENVELMYDRSPVKYVRNNKTPILILHGKRDPRVHPSQSLELYRQLKLHGNAPVRLVWYPGEGHGNRNNPARMDYSLRTMAWFDHYLRGEGNGKDVPDAEISYPIGGSSSDE